MLGGGEKGRVMEREVPVVELQQRQSCPLNTDTDRDRGRERGAEGGRERWERER